MKDKPVPSYPVERLDISGREQGKDVSVTLPSYLPILRVIYGTLGRLIPRLAAEVAFHFFATPMRRASHRREDKLLAAVERFTFPFGKKELKGYHWGKARRKVLLLHGWESRGTALRSLVPLLMDAGYSIWTFDAPAHGDSPGKRLTMPIYGAAIDAFREIAGPFDAMITHSFGGAGALYSLSHKPSATPTKIIMVAVPARIVTIIDSFTEHLDMPTSVRKAFWNLLEKRLQRGIDEVELSQLYQKSQLEEILLMHDENDSMVPVSEAHFLASNMPGARLVLTRGLGHFRIVRHKKVAERIMEEIGTVKE